MCVICGGNIMFDIEHMEKSLKKLNDLERKAKMLEIKASIKRIEGNIQSHPIEYANLILAREAFAKYL